MAEVQHVQLAPHLYCGPVVGAANIQLATCSPNFLILEGIERWQGFHAELLVKPIRWEDGYVIPPTEPGLGVELNEAVIAQHPYRGDAAAPGDEPASPGLTRLAPAPRARAPRAGARRTRCGTAAPCTRWRAIGPGR